MTQSAPSPEMRLYALLDSVGAAWTTYEHPPVFTVAESAGIKAAIAGGHTKNLFLKDKKGRLLLFSALADTQIDLVALSKALGFARFSFGSPDLLWEHLGVRPGSVTAFAMLNAAPDAVRIGLDAALFEHTIVNFHPLRNDATTSVAPHDVVKFLRALGHEPIIVGFDEQGEPNRIDAAPS